MELPEFIPVNSFKLTINSNKQSKGPPLSRIPSGQCTYGRSMKSLRRAQNLHGPWNVCFINLGWLRAHASKFHRRHTLTNFIIIHYSIPQIFPIHSFPIAQSPTFRTPHLNHTCINYWIKVESWIIESLFRHCTTKSRKDSAWLLPVTDIECFIEIHHER
jgi:hypothetical protein